MFKVCSKILTIIFFYIILPILCRHSHANQICRDVCLDILSHCIDWNRVSSDHSPESICATLSPEHPDVSCISLQNYLFPAENPYHPSDGHVSSPCKGDPCESNEICTVNKNCMPGGSCTPYQCTPACKLGEVSISKTCYLVNLINNNAHYQTFILLHSFTRRRDVKKRLLRFYLCTKIQEAQQTCNKCEARDLFIEFDTVHSINFSSSSVIPENFFGVM